MNKNIEVMSDYSSEGDGVLTYRFPVWGGWMVCRDIIKDDDIVASNMVFVSDEGQQWKL